MSADLIERLEAATADQQGEMMRLVGEHCARARLFDYDTQAWFLRFIEVQAYESAAVMLVPKGWVWTINTFANGTASAYCMNESDEIVRPGRNYIATPALAICIAALKATQGTKP